MSEDGPRKSDRAGSADADDNRSADGGTPGPSSPAERSSRPGDLPGGHDGSTGRSRETSWKAFGRDILTSALAVMLVGAYLFAVSGIWPPLVAIESPSMTPNMQENDLVFVMDEERFPGEGAAADTGVVTAESGEPVGYEKFGKGGDVIVYRLNGQTDETPIIHRAMFYVEDGDNWYDRANPRFVGGADSCGELAHCPANGSGFITKGDANSNYDQVQPNVISKPVHSDWVIGTAEARIPGLGWLRLRT